MEEVQPDVVAVSLRLSQSKPVYEAFQAMKEGSSWSKLTEAQQRIVDKNLREFTLGGVALEVIAAALEAFHCLALMVKDKAYETQQPYFHAAGR